jgi:hypothetical protein
MAVKIEKNIPLPTRATYKSRTKREKYPELRQLEVGDSFAVPVKPFTLAAHARRVGKEIGQKFIVRPEGTGARVWRKV